MPVSVDATVSHHIPNSPAACCAGAKISRDEAAALFALESSADIFDLIAGANRIREHFKGNKIHLCSIVNAKAGACSENCSFCAQSSFHQTDAPRYGFVDPEPVQQGRRRSQPQPHVNALGLVAAWRGLKEGPMSTKFVTASAIWPVGGKARPSTPRWASSKARPWPTVS